MATTFARLLTTALAFAGALCAAAPDARAQNYTDLWWNSAESGWGLSLTDHETQLFGVWFTYRADGAPTWYVLPGGTFSEGRRIFSGELYETSGPPYNAPFNPAVVQTVKVGSVRLDFSPPGLVPGVALFTATVGAVSRVRQIQRQPFGNAPTAWATDYSDIWWDPAESGWGLTLAQHGSNVFGVWFTYGTDGKPLFVILPGVTFAGPAAFSGPLYTTNGPYHALPSFDPSLVRVTPVGHASIAFSGATGRFTSTVNGHTQVKTIVRQGFGLSFPSDARIGAHLLPLRAVFAIFDRRGWPNGYYSGDMIRGFDAADTELQRLVGPASTSATIRDEVALQMDRMRDMGINAVVVEIRAADPTFIDGPIVPPTCNVGPSLGPLYPQPAARELSNLRAFLDLAHSKGMRVILLLNNTHMEERPPINNTKWIGALVDAVKGHLALDTVIFGGDARVLTINGVSQCGIPAEAPLWMGPTSYAGRYVKWAIELAMARGMPARKLSAEAVVGNYFIEVIQPPAGNDATDRHLWHPVATMKRIFDELGIPDEERTYALSVYAHRKCANPNGLPGECVDANPHAWMSETLAGVRGVVGSRPRVIAAEFGVFAPPIPSDWPPERALESLTALMATHNIEGGAWWLWAETDENTQAQRGQEAVKRRGLGFDYNPVQRDLAAAYGFRLAAVPNGSFEEGNAAASRWAVDGNGTATRFRLADEAGQPAVPTRGDYALRLTTGAGPTDSVSAWSEAIAVSPSTTYTTTANLRFRWSGDAATGDSDARPHAFARIRYFTASGEASSVRTEDVVRYYQENAPDGFATFPVIYTTPPDARSVKIVLGVARRGHPQPVTVDADHVR